MTRETAPIRVPATSIGIFSTAPISGTGEPREYARRLQEVARWSDAAGCTGILVYTDNSQLDPWR